MAQGERLQGLIDEWWKRFDFSGVSGYVVAEKLKPLKFKLKSWNKEVFGIMEERKKQALQTMAHWDTLGAQRP